MNKLLVLCLGTLCACVGLALGTTYGGFQPLNLKYQGYQGYGQYPGYKYGYNPGFSYGYGGSFTRGGSFLGGGGGSIFNLLIFVFVFIVIIRLLFQGNGLLG